MKKIILTLLAAAAFAGCVKDNGNYAYTDINEVEAVLPQLYKRVYLEDQTVRVQVELTQTMRDNFENLTFSWRYSDLSSNVARSKKEADSNETYIDLEIHATDTKFNHYYWLDIYDSTTGLTYPFQTRVQVLKPFLNTWAVLHTAQDDGTARLGAIEYIEGYPAIVHTDVMTEFGHPQFTGAPKALAASGNDYVSLAQGGQVYNTLWLMTDNANESGVYAPWKKFTPFVDGVYIPQMVMDYASSGFDPAAVTTAGKLQNDGGMVISGGALFQGRNGLKLYKAQPDATLTGDINITHALCTGNIVLMFDAAGKRFISYGLNGNSDNATPVGSFDAVNGNKAKIIPLQRTVNSAPLDNIDHTIIGMGLLRRSVQATFRSNWSFALANTSGGKTVIYLFARADDLSAISATRNALRAVPKEIDTPAGLDENSRVASSKAFEDIAFFSAGATVYMLNLGNGSVTEIYTHPAGGQIVQLRMAKEEMSASTDFDGTIYGHDLYRTLGVAIDRGTSGEVVSLNLNEAGMVLDKEVYTGFGSIKGIAFLADRKI